MRQCLSNRKKAQRSRVLELPIPKLSAMWRNSLNSFSSKLVAFSSTKNPSFSNKPPSLLLLRIYSPRVNYGFFERSNSTSAGSTTGDTVKLGGIQIKDDRVRAFGSSAAAVDPSSLAAFSSAKEVVDLAKHYGQCYWELSKAKLSMLVVATSGAGYVLGSGNAVDIAGLCCTCAGTMMVAAAANSLNQVFEIRNDALMKRTMRRPLPSGRLSKPHAVIWASSVGLAGTALLASQANMLAAGLAASNLVLYAFVYTPLKQIHPINTWVGAVVGAIPPLLGWAAASGQVSLNAMILPAALYFWQLPHFMALAYLCREDYAVGGFRMFSLADPSGQRTALVALRNCIYLLPLGYLAYDWGITSGWFCLESTLLALAISGTAVSFYLNRTTKNARRMFHASLLYLPVFMSGLMFHRLSDNPQCASLENSDKVIESSSSLGTFLQEGESIDEQQNKVKRTRARGQARPPVAFASVAPFPFLPAPAYVSS